MIKSIFYKNKILKTWKTADDEALKQWVLKQDMNKILDKDRDLIEKSKIAIEDWNNGIKAKESDLKAYMDLRKKYKNQFKENNSQLENPTADDVINMDSISLDEINESMIDRKKILQTKYYQSIMEIYSSSFRGEIVRPTSGGLYKSKTPTSDFIDNQPELFNPFDDIVD